MGQPFLEEESAGLRRVEMGKLLFYGGGDEHEGKENEP